MKYALLVVLLAITYNGLAQNNLPLSDKQLLKRRVFQQPLDTLWQRWTTHEGLKSFIGKDNVLELYPGGKFEIYFLPDQPYGKRGSEGSTVLSFLPKQYFSFSWNAPPQFPEVRNHPHKTWVSIMFQPLTPNATELTLYHTGWPLDKRWDSVYAYFDKGWSYVFEQLAKHDQNDSLPSQYPRVNGLGGIFFKCKEPKTLKAWYEKHLGLRTDQYGTNFEWRLANNPSEKGFTQWSPFKETTTYFLPSTKDFMLNYRVGNLEMLYLDLKKEGVTICDTIETYDYGKFLHIMDPEGNKIELWQPVDAVYDQGVNGRTK